MKGFKVLLIVLEMSLPKATNNRFSPLPNLDSGGPQKRKTSGSWRLEKRDERKYRIVFHAARYQYPFYVETGATRTVLMGRKPVKNEY